MRKIIIILSIISCGILFSCNRQPKLDAKMLNSLIIINESVEKINADYLIQVENTYRSIEYDYYNNETIMKRIYDKSKIAKEESKKMIDYINNIKFEFISEIEHISFDEAKKKNILKMKMLDNETSKNFFFGNSNDGSEGKSKELKNKIAEYRKNMLELLNQPFRNILNGKLGLKTNEDYLNIKGEKQNWEMYHFYNTKNISTIIFLNTTVVEVLNFEYCVVNQIYTEVSSNSTNKKVIK
ncbi:MAG: hypothetical protein ACOYO1_20345 [Bacteroidales bacterium]